ncbi:MAG: hypothetical protein WKF83_11045 [Nocardioidaceae bacterium]
MGRVAEELDVFGVGPGSAQLGAGSYGQRAVGLSEVEAKHCVGGRGVQAGEGSGRHQGKPDLAGSLQQAPQAGAERRQLDVGADAAVQVTGGGALGDEELAGDGEVLVGHGEAMVGVAEVAPGDARSHPAPGTAAQDGP